MQKVKLVFAKCDLVFFIFMLGAQHDLFLSSKEKLDGAIYQQKLMQVLAS